MLIIFTSVSSVGETIWLVVPHNIIVYWKHVLSAIIIDTREASTTYPLASEVLLLLPCIRSQQSYQIVYCHSKKKCFQLKKHSSVSLKDDSKVDLLVIPILLLVKSLRQLFTSQSRPVFASLSLSSYVAYSLVL